MDIGGGGDAHLSFFIPDSDDDAGFLGGFYLFRLSLEYLDTGLVYTRAIKVEFADTQFLCSILGGVSNIFYFKHRRIIFFCVSIGQGGY